MPSSTFRAVIATLLAFVLSACSSSRASSTPPITRATFATTAANPVQRENSLPGSSGWEIPADAGTVITGYASETSVAERTPTRTISVTISVTLDGVVQGLGRPDEGTRDGFTHGG